MPKRTRPMSESHNTLNTYGDIRPLIKTGDLIGETGRSIFSWAIRTYNMSEISHVGLAQVEGFNGKKRVSIIESLEPHGVSSRAISSMEYFWWVPLDLIPSHRAEIDNLHFKLKGHMPYSKRGIAIQILKSLPLLGQMVKSSWLDPDRVICSQYVARHMKSHFDNVPTAPNPRDMAKWALTSALDKSRSLGPVLVMCPKKTPVDFGPS